MTPKQQFIKEFTIARAKAVDKYNSEGVYEAANKAWNFIQNGNEKAVGNTLS